MATKEEVMVALDDVEDPELKLSIVELGLVYDVRFEQKDGVEHAEVDMTLTSPGCPAAAENNGGRPSCCSNSSRKCTHQPCLVSKMGS